MGNQSQRQLNVSTNIGVVVRHNSPHVTTTTEAASVRLESSIFNNLRNFIFATKHVVYIPVSFNRLNWIIFVDYFTL